MLSFCHQTMNAYFQSANSLIIASSRLLYAVTRDGDNMVSDWISTTTHGRPSHAVTVIGVLDALLLCANIPSSTAFTSLLSLGSIPLFASYALIALLRLFVTPDKFSSTLFSLGKFRLVFYAATFVFNSLIFAVSHIS